jgi:hypothetical protein
MKTERLTAREIAKIDGAPRINALQVATLAAAKRTGLRLGISVEQGIFHVNALAFAINSAGKATGAADVRPLASFRAADEAAAYLDRMA